MPEIKLPGYLKAPVILFTLIMVLGLLYVGRGFFMPLSLAALLAVLLNPICRRLEKWGMHRIPAIMICLLLIVVILGGLIFMLYTQITLFADDVPALKGQISDKLGRIQHFIEGKTDMSPAKQVDWVKNKAISSLENSRAMVSGAISGATTTMAVLALMPIYIFFFLFYKEKFKTFIFMITPAPSHHKADVVLEELKDVVQNYLSGVFIVVAILAVLNSVALTSLGIPYALFLGILAALLNIIPYIGILIGNIIAATIAFLTKDSLWYPAGVLIAFAVIQFLENNFLTPNIVGNKVSINPLVTIMALIIGGKLWGVTGMILFIPFLGMLKVIFDNVEKLQPYGYLLGTEGSEEHSFNIGGIFTRIKRIFVRNKK